MSRNVYRYDRLDYKDEARDDLKRTSIEALVFLLQYTLNKNAVAFQFLNNMIDTELAERGKLMQFGARE